MISRGSGQQAGKSGVAWNTYEQAYTASEKDGKPLIILCGATWCPHCQTMKNSVLPQVVMSGQAQGVRFVYVDADKDKERFGQLAISTNPGSTPVPQLFVYTKTKTGWVRRHLLKEADVKTTANFITGNDLAQLQQAYNGIVY